MPSSALLADLREPPARGTLQPGDSPYVAPPAVAGDLRFPAKAVRLPDGGLLVADAGHHRLVELAADGETVVRRIGSGRQRSDRRRRGGASSTSPTVCACCRPEVAPAGRLRRRRRRHGATCSAGSGWTTARSARSPGRPRSGCRAGRHPAARAALRARGTSRGGATGSGSRWPASTSCGPSTRAPARSRSPPVPPTRGSSTARRGGVVRPDLRPRRDAADAVCGWSTARPRRCGTSSRPPAPAARTPAVPRRPAPALAQAAARTRPLRTRTFSPSWPRAVRLRVHRRTGVAGADAAPARRGAAARQDGGGRGHLQRRRASLRPRDRQREHPRDRPGRAQRPAVVDGADLVVVESAAHRLARVPLGASARAVGFARTTHRPVTEVSPGAVELVVVLRAAARPEGRRPVRPALAARRRGHAAGAAGSGAGRGTALSRTVLLDARVGSGVLHVAARAASCDDGGGEGAACHMHQQDWGVPVRVVEGATTRLVLPLSGR